MNWKSWNWQLVLGISLLLSFPYVLMETTYSVFSRLGIFPSILVMLWFTATMLGSGILLLTDGEKKLQSSDPSSESA